MKFAEPINVGLKFEIVYADNDLFQIRISAWNGAFAGTTYVYVGLDQLKETAGKLRGFPSGLSDVREITFGGFGPEWAGGATSMRLYCVDGKGHVCIDLRIESDHNSDGKAQSVAMLLFIEPAALDRFIQALEKLDADRVAKAFLEAN
jgi:hypothetical protein